MTGIEGLSKIFMWVCISIFLIFIGMFSYRVSQLQNYQQTADAILQRDGGFSSDYPGSKSQFKGLNEEYNHMFSIAPYTMSRTHVYGSRYDYDDSNQNGKPDVYFRKVHPVARGLYRVYSSYSNYKQHNNSGSRLTRFPPYVTTTDYSRPAKSGHRNFQVAYLKFNKTAATHHSYGKRIRYAIVMHIPYNMLSPMLFHSAGSYFSYNHMIYNYTTSQVGHEFNRDNREAQNPNP